MNRWGWRRSAQDRILLNELKTLLTKLNSEVNYASNLKYSIICPLFTEAFHSSNFAIKEDYQLSTILLE